jgi:signal transduction histidine kinase/ActR/RegA family two-component response regulator
MGTVASLQRWAGTRLRQPAHTVLEIAGDFRSAWGRVDAAASATPNARDIADRQFVAMVRELPPQMVAYGAGILLWLVCFGSFAPSRHLWLWGILATSVMLAELWSCTRFNRSPPSGAALAEWKATYRRGVLIAGTVQGFAMFAPASTEVAAYMTVFMLFFVSGTLSLLVMDRACISLFTVPCGFLTTAAQVLRGDLMSVCLGLAFGVTVTRLLILSRAHSTSITEAMLVAEERQSLLDELGERRREAEQANAAKTTFLASVSHDLRQPMHSIALLVTAARQFGRAEPDVLEQIGASVESMDNLLEALLEVSKLDTGAVPLQLGAFPLVDVLEQVRLKFDSQARAKGLRLEVSAEALPVYSDSFQLERVLSNLVANAVRYTAHGGVRVRCRRRGNLLWVQVWDSGLGIARRHRDKVFEEFFQVSRTARTGKQGLGLGLSIVARTARLLNHPVRLRSREGRGSMFEVGVPLATSHEPGPAQLAGLLDGQVVLLVDDDTMVRRSMVTMLTAFNCQVLSAGSVAEAVRVVDESLRLPDLIITDYRLGDGLTGLDAIEQVRALAGEDILALIVTAEVLGDAVRHASGIPLLSKPLRADALASELKRIAGSGPAASQRVASG